LLSPGVGGSRHYLIADRNQRARKPKVSHLRMFRMRTANVIEPPIEQRSTAMCSKILH
jgi:hypothetical protein